MCYYLYLCSHEFHTSICSHESLPLCFRIETHTDQRNALSSPCLFINFAELVCLSPFSTILDHYYQTLPSSLLFGFPGAHFFVHSQRSCFSPSDKQGPEPAVGESLSTPSLPSQVSNGTRVMLSSDLRG